MNHHFIVSVHLHLDKTPVYMWYDEAWVAIYNATDGEPKTSNLLGRFKNESYGDYSDYTETCDGKAAINLNSQHHDWSSHFLFTLTDTEILENLRCV